jgi:hypothetical protein
MRLVKRKWWVLGATVMGLSALVFQYQRASGAACLKDFEHPRIYRSTISEQKSALPPKGGPSHTELQGDLVLKRTSYSVLEGFFKPLSFASGDVVSREFKNEARRFQVSFNAECLVTGLEFDAQESFGIRDHVMKLMTFLNMGRLAELSADSAFEAKDFLGLSLFEKESDPRKGLSVRRTRILNHPTPAAGDIGLTQVQDIRSSQLSFAGTQGRLWFDRISADESLLVLSGADQSLSKVRYVLHMQMIEGHEDLPLVADHDTSNRIRKSLGEKSRTYERPSMYTDTKSITTSAGLDAALVNFMEELDEDAVKAKRALIAFLKAHPKELERLYEMIAAERFSDHQLVHILFSIAKAGSTEAQMVLADLIGNDAINISTRLRVMFAVPEVPFPDSTLVQAIRNENRHLKDPNAGMNDLSSTALLTAGILARNAMDIAPFAESELTRDVTDVLQNHPNPAVKATALDALGNYGNADFAPLVAEYLDASTEVERMAAAKALVYLPSDKRESLLIERLKIEDRTDVRAALAKSLAMTGITGAASVHAVASRLLTDQDAGQRTLATKVLGQASTRLPEARQSLLNHVTHELDPQVLESAGRYLSAYELNTMRRREH